MDVTPGKQNGNIQTKGPERRSEKQQLPHRLPRIELSLYVVSFSLIIAKLTHSLYLASLSYATDYPWFLDRGSPLLGSDKVDRGNSEWEFWKDVFLRAWPCLAGHALLSRVVDALAWQHRQSFYLVYGTVTVTWLIGPWCMGAVLAHVLSMYAVLHATRRKAALWAWNMALVYTLNYAPFSDWYGWVAGRGYMESNLLNFTLAMLNHRYLAYCLEVCDRPRAAYSARDLLAYVFYLPLVFTGPIVTYDKFERFVRRGAPTGGTGQREVAYRLFWAAKLAAVCALNELILHHLYFSAMFRDEDLLREVDLWTLGGLHVWEALFFYTKYIVMFGLPAQVARWDGLVAPATPSCVLTVAYYTDMWKKFDRGLYEFLKRYIYVPLGGSRRGVARQLAATSISFFYVGYWHGGTDYLYWWVGLNAAEAVLEVGAGIASRTGPGAALLRLLGPCNARRLQALLTAPLLFGSWVAIEAFYNGLDACWIFFDRYALTASPAALAVTAFTCYTCVQVSLEAYHWEVGSEARVRAFLEGGGDREEGESAKDK